MVPLGYENHLESLSKAGTEIPLSQTIVWSRLLYHTNLWLPAPTFYLNAKAQVGGPEMTEMLKHAH